mmetsp:Transcript_36006/g.39804  ORF Transcript_36006/g.39804 Transcript_36006/m.39804 type:complete len:507 (+) Transcript_36006:28-1548(+)
MLGTSLTSLSFFGVIVNHQAAALGVLDSPLAKSKPAHNLLFSTMSNNPTVSISDAFDGGNIEVVQVRSSSSLDDDNKKEEDCAITVELCIKKDPYSELEQVHHFQYFAFRATASGIVVPKGGGVGKQLNVNFVIVNAGDVSFPQAWDGSTVCYSPNLEEDADTNCWQRKLGTRYDQKTKVLSWSHCYESNGSYYFAYFPPFSYQRHLNLVAKCVKSSLATVESLGQSLDGREMDIITIGSGDSTAWIIHRQHPGESMAGYYAEGLLTRLLGLDKQGEIDGTVRNILQKFTLHIIPCMCPDGAFRGHLRTNACGANLNREWATVNEEYVAPSLERSPEVYHVLKRMDAYPPDIFLDIHGDEELPVNFLAGAQGIPKWGKRMESLHGAFCAAYNRSNSDMQQSVGYTPVDPVKVVINTATKVIGTRFNCLASTLEMPFKDCATNPEPIRGWSPNRSRMLGASVLEPLLYIQPFLRVDESLLDFPERDAYVRPQHREFKYGKENEVLDY